MSAIIPSNPPETQLLPIRMSGTKLHVVYAGRGDAFILEYPVEANPNGFVIVDGGPGYYSANTHQDAPYWRYFMSAVQRVWDARYPATTIPPVRPIPPIAPSAIVLSHAHEDHYGGIRQMLLYMSNKPDLFQFNGPFYLTTFNGDAKELRGLQDIENVLSGEGFISGADDSITNPDITFIFPSNRTASSAAAATVKRKGKKSPVSPRAAAAASAAGSSSSSSDPVLSGKF
jgi:hypothetical protein